MSAMTEMAHEPGAGVDGKAGASAAAERFLAVLLDKRKQAIEGRRRCGIEREWLEDEEFYQGIDDANRKFQSRQSVAAQKRWASGYGSEPAGRPHQSVVFVNITKPYVNAAAARVADMLLPTDERSWELRPTPIPKSRVQQLLHVGDVQQLLAAQDVAKVAAEGMQKEIDDCLVESQWHGEVRQVIEDAARLGSGVLKGPVPVLRKRSMSVRDEATGLISLQRVSEIRPGSFRIDPWNLFPDPACGGSLHNGSFVWERAFVSRRQLKQMLQMPGYDVQELARAIKEGPKCASHEDASSSTPHDEGEFEHWIFHGHADYEHLVALGVSPEDIGEGADADRVPAMAEVVNDRLVKVTLSTLDSGDFPYDILPWSERPGLPWGTGVARDIRTSQRMLNGACRALMDNSGLTAAPQIVIGNGVTPEDGNYTLRGGKIWRLEPDAQAADVRAAFHSFHVGSVQAELMGVIQFALKVAEDTTGLPQMLQGIKGDAPDTLGGMEMANNNATSVLRRMAKRFDDYLTGPHIQRYFDWMMQFSEDDSIKGDFEVQVRGSSALVERASQQQFLLQLAAMSRDPVYGIDPAKLVQELAKGQKLDPRTFMLSEQERQQRAQAAQPADPLLQARAQTEQQRAALIQAQTRKTEAEAVARTVEGMFSATQTARDLSMTPGIAVPADEVYRSAGGQDRNAAPIFSEPAPGTPAVPPQTHTNPLTPANPPSPDEGMNQGIEGGQP